jgi:Xaa-Pro aminopeptidase
VSPLRHAGRRNAAARRLAIEPAASTALAAAAPAVAGRPAARRTRRHASRSTPTTQGTAVSLLDSLRAHPLPKELAFAPAEYAARLAAVRAEMERQGLDALLVGNSGNLCWLTGYETVMPSGSTCAIVPLRGEIAVVCPDLELSCVELHTEVREVEIEGWHTGRDVASLIDGRLGDVAPAGTRIGIELGKIDTYSSPSFDPATVAAVQTALPGRAWVDATLLVPGQRLIKSDAELAAMRKAGEYTSIGLEAAIAAVAPGRTDNDLAAVIYERTIGAGSEVMPIDPMIVHGRRAGHMPFLTHRRVPLESGDAVYLESSGAHLRYTAPLMRTANVGAPSDATRRLAEMALAIVDSLLAEIRPGRVGDDVAQIARRAIDRLPPDTFFPGTFGYSCGLGLQPTWTEYPGYVAEGSSFELRPRMTLHLPICLWSPRDRTGVGFSETVEVTDSGCALITPGTGRELVVR